MTTEQAKLNAVINRSDVVPGSGAKNYVRQGSIIGYEVYFESNSDQNLLTTENIGDKIDESGLYSVSKAYEGEGSTIIDYIIITPWTAA